MHQVGKILQFNQGYSIIRPVPKKSFVTSVATAYFGVMVQLKVVEIHVFLPVWFNGRPNTGFFWKYGS